MLGLKQSGRKSTNANNVYNQWLVLAYLENPADFPMVCTCLQLSVTYHATAYTLNVGNNLKRAIYILILVILFSCNDEKKEINPMVVEYQEKGIEYQMENKTDSAIVFYKKAIEIEPTDITTIERLTKIYWWNEQPELALEILNKVPNEIKQSNSILTLKGMTLEKMDKLNESMKLYKKAFEQSPKIRYKNEENLMEFIGYLTLQTIVGQKQQALAEFEQLKKNKLTVSEKQYINTIEPIIRNYNGGGYDGLNVSE